jgi:hypothetical protein
MPLKSIEILDIKRRIPLIGIILSKLNAPWFKNGGGTPEFNNPWF